MIKFADYANKWRDEVLGLKKPSSIATMGSHLVRLQTAFSSRTLAELTNGVVQTYFSGVTKELSPKSVKNLWGTLRLVLGQAQRDGLIDKLPAPVLPKVLRTKQPCFTVEQMQLLLTEKDGIMRVLYHILSETGLRIGEALALEIKDIDLEKLTISVNKTAFGKTVQAPKTDDSNRTICISHILGKAVEKSIHCLKTGFIFFDCLDFGMPPMSQASVIKQLHRSVQQLGIAQKGAIGFHAFRRGNASLCAQIGVPHHIIAMRLGHRGNDITSRYVSLPELADREWAEQIGAVLSGHDVRVDVRKVNVVQEKSTVRDDATSALVNLGYRQKDVAKVVMQVPAYTFDDIIRQSLPLLRVR